MPYIKPLEEKAILNIVDNAQNTLFTGDIYDVREWIEEKVEGKIGIFISLQEYFDTEDKEYLIAIHTDTFEDCTEEEVERIFELGFNESEEPCTAAAFKLLEIAVKFSHYQE